MGQWTMPVVTMPNEIPLNWPIGTLDGQGRGKGASIICVCTKPKGRQPPHWLLTFTTGKYLTSHTKAPFFLCATVKDEHRKLCVFTPRVIILIETVPQIYEMYSVTEKTNKNFLCLSAYVCPFFLFFWWKVLWAIIKSVFAVVGSDVSRTALLTKRVLPGFYCVYYVVLRLIVGSISRGTGRWTEMRHDKPRTVEMRMVAEDRET